MRCSDPKLQQAEQMIRDTVTASEREYSPRSLIRSLTEQGLSEDVVRVAVWYLLDRNEISLTIDWKLAATSAS